MKQTVFYNIGRIFYGVAMAALGFLTIYYRDFPYMLIPPNHYWISDHVALVYAYGAVLFLAGACIVFEKKCLQVSLLLGTLLLLIFCFYFVPYEFIATSTYMQLGAWENAAKELALAGGAFIIAGCCRKHDEGRLFGFLKKLIPLGAVFFPLTILNFGILHFLYAREAAGYIPAWVPDHLFWMYLTGSALIASSTAIILKIMPRLAAALLGTMIFIWVVILHIPKVIAALHGDPGGEITSAFLALAYCGIAFVIAGGGTRRRGF